MVDLKSKKKGSIIKMQILCLAVALKTCFANVTQTSSTYLQIKK